MILRKNSRVARAYRHFYVPLLLTEFIAFMGLAGPVSSTEARAAQTPPKKEVSNGVSGESTNLPALAPTAPVSISSPQAAGAGQSSPQQVPSSPTPVTTTANSPSESEPTTAAGDPAPSNFAATPIRNYSLQIGAFATLQKASYIKSVLENLGPTRIDKLSDGKGGILYRVLVGNFESPEKAKAFGRENKLDVLFPKVWLNAVAVDSPGGKSDTVSASEIEKAQDPYLLHATLYCDAEHRVGEERLFTKPEGASDSELKINLSWNCIPNPKERWIARDEERSPSHAAIVPLFSMGSLTNTNPSGNQNLIALSPGIQASAFKSFGGMGPLLEYRIQYHRYAAGDALLAPQFLFEHRLNAGARLPIGTRIEAEPVAGFMNTHLFTTALGSSTSWTDLLIPQAGLRARVKLIEMSQRASLDAAFGYHFLFGAASATTTLTTGYQWYAQIRARHYNPSTWGMDWFAEFLSQSQGATGVTQSESHVLLGVSFLVMY